MKAYQIGDQAGLSSLTLVDKPDPVCGPGEALIRVGRICLNHRDLKILAGGYGPRRAADLTPCSDGMGTVEAVGPDVSTPSPGDRVTCGHFVSWLDGAFSASVFSQDLGVTRNGWLAETVLVPAAALVRAPETLDDDQLAPLPSAGVTAWHAVVEMGRVQAGDLVLVLGTGGVAMLALKIAKMHGARVAVTSSSDEKLRKARELGADILINYSRFPVWSDALLHATGGRGANIIVETGGEQTLRQSLAAAAVNGRIAVIGSLSGGFGVELPNFALMISKSLVLRGIAAGNRRMLQALVAAAAANSLRPAIDQVFPFVEARAAYARLQSAEHVGKVVIEPPRPGG